MLFYMTSWMGKKDSDPSPVEPVYGIVTTHTITNQVNYSTVVWIVSIVDVTTGQAKVAPAGGLRINVYFDSADESATTSSFIDIPAGQSTATISQDYNRRYGADWNADFGVYATPTYQLIDGTEIALIPLIPAAKPEVFLQWATSSTTDSFLKLRWAIYVRPIQSVDVVVPVAYTNAASNGIISKDIIIPANAGVLNIDDDYIRYETSKQARMDLSLPSNAPYTLGTKTGIITIPARPIPPARTFTVSHTSVLKSTTQEITWKISIVGGPAVIRHQFNVSYNSQAWGTGGSTITMLEGQSEWTVTIAYYRPNKGTSKTMRCSINLNGGGSYSLENHLDTRYFGGNPNSIDVPLTPMP